MKLAMLAALLSQPGPGERFDLICAGTQVTGAAAGHVAAPYAARLRVDLAALRWCEGDCREVRAIAGLGPGIVTLEERSGAPDGDEVSHRFYRHTLRHYRVRYERHDGAIRTSAWEGQCRYAPFGGLSRGRAGAGRQR